MSQRVLARSIGTSQPTLATLETGNPTLRTLMRVADATGFDLLGTLKPNPHDDLADFIVLREPSPAEGPR